jgi:uncharacterized repeat protein (TIGR01451 family)
VTVEDTEFENQATAQITGSGQLDLSQATVLPFNGLLSPGSSPGILTVDGALEEGPDATVLIEIGGEIPGSSLDRLDVTGALTIDGLLDVDLLAPYHPVGGEQYQILTFDQSLGWFDSVDLPALQHMLYWDIVTSSQDVWLEVLCDGTQLGVVMTADNDPVSVGEDVTYHVIVTNHSTVTATGIVVTDVLPPELVFEQMLSSPECALVGSTVECNIAEMLTGSTWAFSIVAEAAVAGPIENTVTVESWECDIEPSNNQSTVTINAVLAEPCDSNYDLAIDSDDVESAVHHIFGQTAPGNPDCRQGGGVGADDVSAIIEECQ